MAATAQPGGVKQHLSQGHSSLGSKWEILAALTEEQQVAVSELGQACANQPLPVAVLAREAAAAQAAAELQPPPTPTSPTVPGSPHAGAGEAGHTCNAGGNTHPQPTVFQDAVLQHSSDFYRWLSELEGARGEEATARFGAYRAQLAGHVGSAEAVLSRLSSALAALDAVASKHGAVAAAGSALSAPCEALEAARASRESLAAALRSRLDRFDEVERLAGEAVAAGGGNSAADPVALLTRLDAALDFLAAHPHWVGAAAASASLRQLQARTLGTLRSRVAAVLRSAAAAVVAERARLAGKGISNGDQVPASAGPPATMPSAAATTAATDSSASEGALLAVRFRAAAEPALGPLLAGIEARAGERADYARLLADCQAAYCATRVSLLAPDVIRRVATEGVGGGAREDSSSGGGRGGGAMLNGSSIPATTASINLDHSIATADQALAAAVRGSARYLRRLMREEASLFSAFFPRSPARRALTGLADPLTQHAYDGLRPRVVASRSVTALAAAVDAAEAAVMTHNSRRSDGNGSGPVAPPPPVDDEAARELLAPMLRRLLGDLRERLIFRAQAFLRERVSGYRELPRGWSGSGGGHGTGGEGAAAAATAGEETATMNSNDAYPPVAATLYLLNLLAPRLEAQTFAGVAHEALAAATLSVLSAGRALTRVSGGVAVAVGPGQQRSVPAAAPTTTSTTLQQPLPPSLQAQLFVVSQLLALRGGAAAHRGAFSVVERDLDFSHTRETLRRAAAGQLPLFTLAPSSVVVQLLSRGAPRLAESTSDAKRELDRELKAGCESLIMGITKTVVDPALSFLSKASAASSRPLGVAGGGKGQADQAPPTPKPLFELAFASPERVAELTARLRAGLHGAVPGAAAALVAALPHADARRALTGPIAANVREAIDQLNSLLDKEYPAGALAPGVAIDKAELDAALAPLEA